MIRTRKPAPPRPPARRGVLMLIAILLASSGMIRLGLGLSEARALDVSPAVATSKPAVCPTGGDPVMPVVTALKAREERLAAREAAVADRAQALMLTGRVVDDKLATLKAAEDSLSAKLTLADGAAEADVARLTTVYETMKPKDAAAVFQQMAPDFAAGFLGRMKPEAAAMILSGLTPEKAYTVSVILAGRNAAAPKN